MTRRSRRDEIVALLAQREREGLTYEQLARRSDLAANTLAWWSWRLRREARDRVAFAEVELREEGDAVAPSRPSAGLTVRRGEWSVEVGDDIDMHQLHAVLRALAELPC